MSRLLNKIIFVNKRRTSMRLSIEEWDSLKEICKIENIAKNELLSLIEDNSPESLGLTYSTRLFMLKYFRDATTSKGHKTANHGKIIRKDKILIDTLIKACA
jgi:predicted DNA-binding ribbon-helix-helix protein